MTTLPPDFQALPPQHQRRTSAFTLIELLAVIGVMVILLSFTMPVLRGGGNMEKTAWDIAGIIQGAQAYAQANNTYVWVGLNTANVTDSATGTSRVSIFAVASKDGSDNTKKPDGTLRTDSERQANLILIDRVRTFDNVTIVPPTGTPFTFGGRPTTSVTPITSTRALPLPTTVRYRTPGGTYTSLHNSSSNYFLRINPSGSIAPDLATPAATVSSWLELGLQGTRGLTAAAGQESVIQISSLSGRVKVFRPGLAVASATSTED